MQQGGEKTIDIIIYAAIALVTFLVGYLVRRYIAESKIKNAEEQSRKIVAEAEKQAETKKKEVVLEAKEEVHKLRSELDKETRDRRNEIQRIERRLLQREELLDKKVETIEQREEAIAKKQKEIQKSHEEVQELYKKQVEELERLSGLSSDEAKQLLLNDIEKQIRHEAAIMMKDIETKAKEEAERKAKEIVSYAIQKCSADHVAETTVSVVPLPNDEMKGRIIGREGRNIRTLETLTGIDLIIDDTPEAVILSGFDPIRREVARVALEKLIVDGRIHPARIEEMVEKS
ncbi:MAG: Rnase Y domain-containing protein, partial [Caulobacteraceae bacterium]